jgi:hypothetical protein
LKYRKNKIVSIICSFALLLASSNFAYASESDESIDLKIVTEIDKGQKAPFSGVLLNELAAAKLFADLKFTEKECELKLDKELKWSTIVYSAQIESFKLRLQVETERTEKLLSIKDDRIKFLEERYTPPVWYETGAFWVTVGVISGVLVTIGAGYALGQVD